MAKPTLGDPIARRAVARHGSLREAVAAAHGRRAPAADGRGPGAPPRPGARGPRGAP